MKAVQKIASLSHPSQGIKSPFTEQQVRNLNSGGGGLCTKSSSSRSLSLLEESLNVIAVGFLLDSDILGQLAECRLHEASVQQALPHLSPTQAVRLSCGQLVLGSEAEVPSDVLFNPHPDTYHSKEQADTHTHDWARAMDIRLAGIGITLCG